MDAFVAGMLYPSVARDCSTGQYDVLAYLLPTWGFREGVVAALTSGPGLFDGSHPPKQPGVITALLAARAGLGDPCGADIVALLESLGVATGPAPHPA